MYSESLSTSHSDKTRNDNDKKVPRNLSTSFPDKFTGKLGENINNFIRNYANSAADYELRNEKKF